MVNEVIYNYLKEHSKNYPLDALKAKIIASGYKKEDVDEVIRLLAREENGSNEQPAESAEEQEESKEEQERSVEEQEVITKPVNQELVNQNPINKELVNQKPVTKEPISKQPVTTPLTSKDSGIPEKTVPVNRLWFLFSGLAGILAGILLIVSSVLETLVFKDVAFRPVPITMFLALFSSILFIFFFLGFFILGKKYNNKFLRVASLLFIFFMVIVIICQVLSLIYPVNLDKLFVKEIFFGDYDFSSLIDEFLVYLIVAVVLGTIYLVLNILFGIAIVRLGENVKSSKFVGILHAIGGGLLVSGIGVLFLYFALIFETILLMRSFKKD